VENQTETAAEAETPIGAVRAKMRAMTVKPSYATGSAEIMLMAVYEKEGPNRKWALATPMGQLTMTIDNPRAAAFFEQGRTYYIDIVECPDEEQNLAPG